MHRRNPGILHSLALLLNPPLQRRPVDLDTVSHPVAAPGAFQFLDPGPLVDGELELVAPQQRWAEELLEACRHPLTIRDAPIESQVTREGLNHFLAAAPLGREPADPAKGRVPAYYFWILLRHGAAGPTQPPPVRIAGGLTLRVAATPAIERYYGHLGYHVYPPARGNAYAERSCRLLLPLARRHGLRSLWITCNPDNAASRRTCERLGAVYVDTLTVPPDEPLYARGDTHKCRYLLDLTHGDSGE
jgi:predicted acetyltransferase